MTKPSPLGVLASCLSIACVCSVVHGEEPQAGKAAIGTSDTERAARSHGIWYTPGTAENYGNHRPDKSYPEKKYARVYPGKDTVYSGPMATYCAWHRPMAIHVPSRDKTFFVFGNPRNWPVIGYYDHAGKTFAGPVVLGTNPDMDAHRNPTILIDEAGHVLVFFGAHGHPTKVVKSVSPYDISRWAAVADIEDKGTSYPQPWQLNGGEIFVSYRQRPGWCYRKSTDGAATWQPPVNLINFRGAAIYLVSIAQTGAYPRKIHVAWSKMGGGSPEEIRTKALWARRYNVYYACSDDGGTTWKRRNGSVYSLPITERAAELIHDCGDHGVWLKDIQLDSAGTPYILFLDSDTATHETTWKVATYSAHGWRKSDVTTSDHMYDGGGLVILADNDIRLYGPATASQDHEDGGEIEEWTSTDKGKTWQNTRHVTSGSKYSHNHVKVVYNGGKPDFRMMWSYGDSHHPPATRNVYLYRYGEGLPGPKRMRFPSSCLREPVTGAVDGG